MQLDKIANHIKIWLTNYIKDSNLDGFVIGVSGGVDSALTATLAASTGYKTLLLNMPIYQQDSQFKRSVQQIKMLEDNYDNVSSSTIDLTAVFKSMEQSYPDAIQDELTMANARARLRMTTLYAYASSNKLLVTGTGNKIEDFGVGFYTKYGDGGVDISPIADLLKSEVFQLAEHLNVSKEILNAKPTDGLWGDDRSDEDQLGASFRIRMGYEKF
jgi:NAD+ synthase